MAFIFAFIVLFLSIVLAFLWAYVEAMAPAPKYTNTPWHILIIGGSFAIFIASTHWYWLPKW